VQATVCYKLCDVRAPLRDLCQLVAHPEAEDSLAK
jgi:hypothetical protein